MKKRQIIITSVGVLLLAGGILLARNLGASNEAEGKQESSPGTAVESTTVESGPVQAPILISGRVKPAESIDLFAEVSGVAYYGETPFKSGNDFQRGDVLLHIDSREFRRSLNSQRTSFQNTIAQALPDIKIDYPDAFESWDTYLENIDIDQSLPPLPEVDNRQLKLYLTGNNIYTGYYSIKELEARLSKYTIRAPFPGTLVNTQLNQGTLVRVGQQLGTFIQNNKFEIEGSVKSSYLPFLRKGMDVTFKVVNGSNRYPARLTRINQEIDPTTQLVKIYFESEAEGLASGAYLQTQLTIHQYDSAVVLPVQALVDDQFVFTIQDGKAIKTPITLLEQTADEVIIKNLASGSKVITDRHNASFEGSQVIEIK